MTLILLHDLELNLDRSNWRHPSAESSSTDS